MIIKKLDEFFNKKDEWNAFITICREEAYDEGEWLQAQKAKGETFPLDGILVGVKDNICTKGIKTTCASKMLESFVSPYDAEAVSRLKAGGGIVVGKTNMDEFAMGSTGASSAFGQALNPVNINKVPGGSSGGSAVAVAAGLVDVALGTDTGGSVRQPSAICGIVGFKPTYGRISRYGLIAYASSFDAIGIMAKTPGEIKRVYKCISGFDPKDSTSSKAPEKEKSSNLKRLRVGVDRLLMEDAEAEIREATERGIGVFQKAGAICEYFDFNHGDLVIPAYFVTAYAQAASNLSRFDGLRYGFCDEDIREGQDTFVRNRTEGFGEEVKRRILAGNFFLTQGRDISLYERASQIRRIIGVEYKKLFESYDVIISPAYMGKTDDIQIKGEHKGFFGKFKYERSMIPANLCGFPAISVPCGRGSDNMPIGMHMMSEKFTDEFLLDIADFYMLNKDNAKKGMVNDGF